MAGVPNTLRPVLAALSTFSENQVAEYRCLPARPPSTQPLPATLDTRLVSALGRLGIISLYSHQRATWEAVLEGRHTVVVTATSSGKTLCFNLPVVQSALRDPTSHALYLYPTKALANDQAAGLVSLTQALPITFGIYHGDTGRDERERLRAAVPNILISNPDTIHHNQLARHAEWAQWWASLRYVVLDEAHAYRGVFGSHVSHVLRRLRRLAEHYGADPVFIAASATIGNPGEHMSALTGHEPVVVDDDGSPRVARDVVLWRPSLLSELETARLMAAAARSGQSVIGFARTRRAAEHIRRAIHHEFVRNSEATLDEGLASYRAGYRADRRREIEAGLRNGTIRAVIATNALELGIDIGSLDVAVLSAYPGSTMAFRQQSGRAGRRDRPALVVMVIAENPLDEYVAEHPDWLLESGAERAAVDPANETVARGQLSCAARELPLRETDKALYGDAVWKQLDLLRADGVLVPASGGLGASPGSPTPRDVNLRSLEGHPFDLFEGRTHIGEIDAQHVVLEAHPGAIYLHDGEPYRVRELDRRGRRVLLEQAPEGVITRPLGERYVNRRAIHSEYSSRGGRLTVRYCDLHVRSRIAAYQEIDERTRHPVGSPQSIDPVTTDLYTQGLEIAADTTGEGLHAFEHVLRALAPVAVICDPADLDGHTDLESATTGNAYVFDRTPGGSGLASKLMDGIETVIVDVVARLQACGCKDGCPLCIHLGNCWFHNDSLSKADLAALLSVTLPTPRKPDLTPRRPHPETTPCPLCGRTFAETSWSKGYPYQPHNRVKGTTSKGVCPGAPRTAAALPAARTPVLRIPAVNGPNRVRAAAHASMGLVRWSPRVRDSPPMPHRAVPPKAPDPEDARRRYESVCRWRDATAARVAGVAAEDILSTRKVRMIADRNPLDSHELQAIGHFGEEWMAAFAEGVLSALRRS